MKKYTVGFIFDEKKEKVLLMHKTKPAWQAGKLNGLGGKIEEGETSLENFVREIKEESNLNLDQDQCVYVGKMQGSDWYCDVFAYVYQGDMSDAKSLEVEEIGWFSLYELPENLISNVRWLIGISFDKIMNPELEDFIVNYR